MKRLLLIFISIQFVLVSTAFAQWQVNGIMISSTENENNPEGSMIPDGFGGIIVAYTHFDPIDSMDVYVQRLDASGFPLWGSAGVRVCGAAHSQAGAILASDGSGGVIVAWFDQRNGGNYYFGDLYAQRVNAAGVVQWTTDGVPICTAVGMQLGQKIVADGLGGAIIAWQDERYGVDIYAQRVNSAGIVLWPADGRTICLAAGAQLSPALISDGVGGATLAWPDFRSGTGYHVFAQRIDGAGTGQWPEDGVAVCPTPPGFQIIPRIVSDGAGGTIIAWTDFRDANQDIYAQRLNAAGVAQWPANGAAVCADPASQQLSRVSPTSTGGIDLVWFDQRNDTAGDVYVQRLSSAGAPLWTLNGRAIATGPSNQSSGRIVSTPSGTFVTWSDSRAGNYDIYAQKLDATGAPQWTANGVAVCAATGDQSQSDVVSDGIGGVIADWLDARSGSNAIFAQRITGTGESLQLVVTHTEDDNLPGSLRAAILQSNATPGAQKIGFNIPGPGPHVIDVFVSTIPAITDALTIDGFTQPGSSPNTNPIGSPSNAQIQVEIMGWSLVGLDFQATGTVRGVAINGFGACISAAAPYVVIEGNYIGTDHTGTQLPGFLQHVGVVIQGDHVRVGGAAPASRNVILYGTEACIRIYGAPNAEVYGNYIGVGADAATTFENYFGIDIMNNATGARIGSSTIGTNLNPAEANLIMNCFKNVVVRGAGSIGNFIAGNSMLGTYLMIDLSDDSYTLNDALDTDVGPNGLQNYPVLSSAAGSQINGTMDGAANMPLYLHFYWSADCCLNAAHYLGGTLVTLDANGSSPFTFSPAGPIPPGVAINATASDLGGNTSEVAYAVTYQNTGSGASQVATLMSAGGTVYGTATYANVTGPGNTYTTNPYTPPVPVSGYAIGNPNDPQIYFNITTDASYTGGIDVCLNYNENAIPGPEANLVLLHYDGSMWANVTTSRDLVNNRICGHVTSLSPFVIGAVTTTGVQDKPIPNRFALRANVPNPFNPATTITYDVPAAGGHVNIAIFDVAGRRVRTLVDEQRPAGVFSVQWNGDDDRGQRVASGVYFYRMRAGSFVETKKMVLLK